MTNSPIETAVRVPSHRGVSERFRREFRIDPVTGGTKIFLPEYDGNIVEAQISPDGKEITRIYRNGVTVKVITPTVPLFLLEQHPIVTSEELSPLNTKKGGFGVDERFLVEVQIPPDLESRIDVVSPQSLELLLESFKLRYVDLRNSEQNGCSLRQFHYYARYYTTSNSLVGRLLATKEIAPVIREEVIGSFRHFEQKERCVYCDMVKELVKEGESSEHRGVSRYGDIISSIPFAPEEQYSLLFLPTYHISRITDIGESTARNLAQALYTEIMKMKYLTRGKGLDNIEMAFHSAPFYLTPFLSDILSRSVQVEDVYHTHAEITAQSPPSTSTSYRIPGTGWSVVQGRPKITAEAFRNLTLGTTLNHQP